MSDYYGNRIEDSLIEMEWNSHDGGTGASITQTGLISADVAIFKNGGVAQKTTTNGIAIFNNFDGRTGLHLITIDTGNDTGDGGFWVAQADYQVAIDSVTIDGQTVRFWVGHFSIENEAAVLTPAAQASIVDDVWNELVSGHTTFGSFGQSFQRVIFGRVDDGAPTSADFDTDSFVEATTTHFDDSRMVFVTGALLGQSRIISLYGGGAGQNCAFDDPWSQAPANNDEFIIIPLTGAKDSPIQAPTNFDQLSISGTGEVALTAASRASIADDVWDEDIVAAHGGASAAGLLLRVLGGAIATRANNPTLDALLGVVDAAGRDLPEQVWLEAVRVLTANTNLNDPTAAQNATAVWDELLATARAPLSYGQRIKDAVGLDTLTAARVSNLDSLDAAITSRAVPGDAMALTAGAVDDIWDEAKAGHVAGGSFGEEVQAHALSSEISALNDISTAEVNVEMLDVMNVDTLGELVQGVPPTNPTHRQAQMLMYMALRNRLDIDTGGATDFKEIHNNAGVVITKKALTDDGTIYSEALMESGP